ncbi:LysE family transporter [Cellulomonas sp. P4]|uniref:LysE family transporter n=1 Tax=Cellulomonas sp. P4 TaxID=3142533 RepID=UPI0031BB0E6B
MPALLDAPAASALAAGVLAGLGVAVPLGPVGVLVARTAALDGWRHGMAAAGGVAAVDCGYAVVAATGGAALARALAGRERALSLGAAAVLVVVGLVLLRAALTAPRGPLAEAVAAPGPGSMQGPGSTPEPGSVPGPGPLPGLATSTRRPLAVAGRFVLLTAVNPLTVVTFAAVAASVPGRAAGVWFVVGVAAASGAWQSVLAGAGAVLGRRVGAAGRRATGVVGAGAVLAAAVVALARAV